MTGSKINAVYCPTDWKNFRNSCYKPYLYLKTWKAALEHCQRLKGATLVSLDDKEEEAYVKYTMKLEGVATFHNATQNSPGLLFNAFMCEFKPGKMRRSE